MDTLVGENEHCDLPEEGASGGKEPRIWGEARVMLGTHFKIAGSHPSTGLVPLSCLLWTNVGMHTYWGRDLQSLEKGQQRLLQRRLFTMGSCTVEEGLVWEGAGRAD